MNQKDIFDARIQYMLNGDRDTFVESVEPYLSNIVSWELKRGIKKSGRNYHLWKWILWDL